MVKMLQMSGLPGSFRVTRAGSVAAGLSFSQMISAVSKRLIVLPRLFDILSWPSSPLRVGDGRAPPEPHVDRAVGPGRRLVRLRDGVQVHDTEQAVVLVLQLDPILDGAEVIADVQLA